MKKKSNSSRVDRLWLPHRFRVVMIALVAVISLATIALGIVAVVNSGRRAFVLDFCFFDDGNAYGAFHLDPPDRSVSWDLVLLDHASGSDVDTIAIHGPTSQTSPLTAPVFIELCGTSGTSACDVTGEIDGKASGSGSLRTKLLEINDAPTRYYARILYTDTSEDIVRFVATCGT